MVNDIKLQHELESNNIHYTKMNKSYVIDISGSSLIIEAETMPEKYGSKSESILSIFWSEKEPSQRTIDLAIVVDTKETYDTTMQFLFALIELVEDGEIHMENNILKEKISKLFTHLNLVVTKFYIDGLNLNIENDDEDYEGDDIGEIEYHEKPKDRNELKQAMDKAIEDGDKESYYKYQQMLNSLKENVSFKYLKTFRDFF